MDFKDELKAVFREVGNLIIEVANVRDTFLMKGGEGRFMRLAGVGSNLQTIEGTLFQYMEAKPPMFGKKPDREVLMIARAAADNAKAVIEFARLCA